MSKIIVDTLILQEPIGFGDDKITELKFEKPRAKHFRSLQVDQSGTIKVGNMMDVGAALVGLPPEIIDEFSPADAFALVAKVTGFMFGGQPTGLPPSNSSPDTLSTSPQPS